MSHIFFWISILGWGVGLTAFTLFAIRAQKERLVWLKLATFYTLSGFCYLILQQIIFYLFTVVLIPYPYISVDMPILGLLGSIILPLHYLLFTLMILKGTGVKIKKAGIIVLTAVIFLLNSGGFFHYGHTFFFKTIQRPLWTWKTLYLSQLLIFAFAGFLPSIWALIKTGHKNQSTNEKHIFIIACINIVFSPFFLVSHIKYHQTPYIYNDFEVYYFFFILGFNFVLFSIVSIFMNIRAVKQYLFPLPEKLPLELQKELAISLREADVINQILLGLRPAEIGKLLFISTRTVNAHIQNIYKKLAVSGRPALIQKLKEYTYTK